jgi:competence protein ComEA
MSYFPNILTITVPSCYPCYERDNVGGTRDMPPTPPYNSGPDAQATYQFPQRQTMPQATTTNPLNSASSMTPVPHPRRQNPYNLMRIVAAVIVVGLAIALYFIWSSPTTAPASPSITQQNVSTSSFTTNATNTTTISSTGSSPIYRGSNIQVYVVGAVKHPGVYTLPADARVYQLLQAAGGPLPNANLVALNMAAKLSDGQEIYVAAIGETPPANLGGAPGPGTGPTGTSTGQLININTASVDQMHLALHISSKTAQKIVDYRTQHGNYTSVDQLSQVVSKAVYDKIKDQVTV